MYCQHILKKNYLNIIKTCILTTIVIISFILASVDWNFDENEKNINKPNKIIIGACILAILYILLIFEFVDRTLAALIGAAMSIAAHDYLIDYVDMFDIIRWQDLETLSLLFGMMIISSIVSVSGIFDYLAIWCYKKSRGNFWLLIITLSMIVALLSSFIDNVSTMLLLTPTLIKLSQLEQLDPRYFILIMVMISNIGGCATPVGDPPNLIIIGHPIAKKLDITFLSFVFYCTPGLVLIIIAILIYLKLVYKSKESFILTGKCSEACSRNNVKNNLQMLQISNSNKPESFVLNENELLKELKMLKLFSNQLNEFGGKLTTFDDDLREKIINQTVTTENILTQLETKITTITREERLELQLATSCDGYNAAGYISSSKSLYTKDHDDKKINNLIKSKIILVCSIIVLIVTLILFCVQSFIPRSRLTLGWISLFGGLILLVMCSTVKLPKQKQIKRETDNPSNDDDDDGKEEKTILHYAIEKVEWSLLIFFFGLFIIMECLARLGLISILGQQISSLIDLLPGGQFKSIGAISIILWSCAISSAMIDNIPITSMMVKILSAILELQDRDGGNTGSDLNIKGLIFALAFGVACGGNGTLIGASANLVSAAISARNGYPISFNRFLKFGFMIAFISLVVANIYLVIVFVVFDL